MTRRTGFTCFGAPRVLPTTNFLAGTQLFSLRNCQILHVFQRPKRACMRGDRAAQGHTSGSRRVAIGIDSGAEIPVWPETLHSEVETHSTQQSLSGEAYWAPGDLKEPSVKNLGIRNYSIEAYGHTFTHTPNICQIRKPLLAVSGLNDKGWGVHFMSKEGAWMEHRQTSTFINFKRTGVFLQGNTGSF